MSSTPASVTLEQSKEIQRFGTVVIKDTCNPTNSLNIGDSATLEQLSNWALKHAPSLKIAQAQIRLAQAGKLTSRYWTPYNPNVQIELGLRQLPNEFGLDVGLGFQQQFEIGGQRKLRKNVAKAQIAQAQANYQSRCWYLKSQIKMQFRLTLLNQQRMELTKTLTKVYEHSLELAQKRVDAGQKASAALLALKVDLAQLKQQNLTAQSDHQSNLNTLAELSGWPETETLKIQGVLSESGVLPKINILLQRAMNFNPLLRQQVLTIAKRQSQTNLQEKEALIDPTLGLSYGREGGSQAVHLYMLMLSIEVPLFDKNQTKIAESQAQVVIEQARYQQIKLRVRSRIRASYIKAISAQAHLKLYSESIEPTLQKDLSNIQRAFEAGQLDISKLALVQQRVLSAQFAKLDALRRFEIAKTQLEQLTGKPLN